MLGLRSRKNRVLKRNQEPFQYLTTGLDFVSSRIFNRKISQLWIYFFIFFFHFFKIGFHSFAFAIVNIESLRKEKIKDDRFQGSFALSFRQTSGNTEKLSLNLKSHLLFKGKNSENLLFFTHRLGKSRKVRDMNQSLLHMRHTHFSDSHLALEGYGQLQTNEFTRLRLRALIGGGLRKRLLDREVQIESESKNRKFQKIYLGFGSFYSEEYKEKLENSDLFVSQEEKESAFRLSTYLSFSVPLDSFLSLKMIFYFQPKWKDIKDYHILEEASLEVQVRRFIFLVFTQSFSFDSRAPRNVKKGDLSLNSSLRFTF